MKTSTATIAAGTLAIGLCLLPVSGSAGPGDVAQIRALEAHFTAAFNAKNINAIMKVYVPGRGLLAFDVVPPRQYVGAAAYRKDWENFFAVLKGPPKFEIRDLIAADRTLAYSHSIQHVSGTDIIDKPLDLTLRVTRVYRKIGGRWLVVHEHVSVPVDLDTGKPDLASKP